MSLGEKDSRKLLGFRGELIVFGEVSRNEISVWVRKLMTQASEEQVQTSVRRREESWPSLWMLKGNMEEEARGRRFGEFVQERRRAEVAVQKVKRLVAKW